MVNENHIPRHGQRNNIIYRVTSRDVGLSFPDGVLQTAQLSPSIDTTDYNIVVSHETRKFYMVAWASSAICNDDYGAFVRVPTITSL